MLTSLFKKVNIYTGFEISNNAFLRRNNNRQDFYFMNLCFLRTKTYKYTENFAEVMQQTTLIYRTRKLFEKKIAKQNAFEECNALIDLTMDILLLSVKTSAKRYNMTAYKKLHPLSGMLKNA